MSPPKPSVATLKAARAAALSEAKTLLDKSRDGLRAARHLSATQDRIIKDAFGALADANDDRGRLPFCLCATGGYGRGELAPGSDLDLLLLHQGPAAADVEKAYADLLYLLWDCGLKVGHALRRPEDCAALAAADAVSATALMDVRVLAGNPALVKTLHEGLAHTYSARADRAFIAAKLAERDARHARLGDSRYMVEPHVKDGKGGLRDLQTLGWLTRRLAPEKKTAREALAVFLDPAALRRTDRALRFMWTVRFWLHLVAGRAEDRLGFDVQPELARVMGYRDTPAVERLMKAYYLKARDVGIITRMLCTRLEMLAAKRAPSGLSRFLPQRRKRLRAPGFVTEAGRLDFENGTIPAADPLALLRLFAIADASGHDLHPAALQLVRTHLGRIDARFRRDPAAAQVFLDCLDQARNPQSVLRVMGESGVLGRYIPEFGHIIGRTQFNMYHCYSVDEHSLRAVGIVHDLLNRKAGSIQAELPWTVAIASAIENRRALMLAMLLHDTGKGKGDQQTTGAAAARRACTRLGLPAQEVNLVGWLVGHHLLMSDTAQRRDLGDPRTILDFANVVQTPERLRLLLLLTIADIRAVGPGVWNGWKERLLRELFETTQTLFRGKSTHSLQSLQERAHERAASAQKAFVEASTDKDFATHWVQTLGPSYWSAFSPQRLAQQGRWAADLSANGAPFGIMLEPLAEQGSTLMQVLADDAPGLFSGLCAAVCAAGGNIAGAQIFTTREARAFDVFHIQDRRGHPFGDGNPAALERLRALAHGVLRGEPLPKPAAVRPSRRAAAFAVLPSVVFDNDAASDLSVIEASGRDRQGLLHDLARVLRQSGLNIRSAHIATYGARAVDIFYVHERNGGKIANARRRQAIGAKLRDVLHAGMRDNQPSPPGQARASERQ